MKLIVKKITAIITELTRNIIISIKSHNILIHAQEEILAVWHTQIALAIMFVFFLLCIGACFSHLLINENCIGLDQATSVLYCNIITTYVQGADKILHDKNCNFLEMA